MPTGNDPRANISTGGRSVPLEIGAAERGIVEAMSDKLVADGMFLVGIDVIGGKVVEINAESPGGLQSVERLYAIDVAPPSSRPSNSAAVAGSSPESSPRHNWSQLAAEGRRPPLPLVSRVREHQRVGTSRAPQDVSRGGRETEVEGSATRTRVSFRARMRRGRRRGGSRYRADEGPEQ